VFRIGHRGTGAAAVSAIIYWPPHEGVAIVLGTIELKGLQLIFGANSVERVSDYVLG
jgi:hypothetical protein